MNRRLLAIPIAAILLAAPAAHATTAKEVEALVLGGKLDEAVGAGRTAIGKTPDDVDLRLATARALAAKARRFNHVLDVKLTQADLDRGQVAIPPDDLNDAPLQVAYDAGLFEEAILNLDEGIKRAPKREDVRVFKCFLLTDANRIDRAKVAIQETLDALPRNADTAKTMAAFAAERTRRKDAEGGAALLAPVAAAFPTSAAVHVDYGNILTRLNRKQEADAAFDRAARLMPKDARIARTRAIGAMIFRDYKRARSAFDAVYRISGDPQDQMASYVAAYGVDPSVAVPLIQTLAAQASGEGVSDDIAALFAGAGTKGPASPEAMTLAERLVEEKLHVLVIPVLDRAIRANPNLGDAKTMITKVYADLGCPRLAPK
jgi:tetratricopeptide (TPR) repeat protein